MNSRIVHLGDRTYRLNVTDFGEEIDLDSLLKIDYSNILGEMVTFPSVVHRFGTLLAEAESAVQEAKLTLDVFEAKTKERLRVELAEANNGKAPTVEALNNATVLNPGYQAMKRRLIDAQKTRDYINSAFWSAKDKSDKLSAIFRSSEIAADAQLEEGRLNGVDIQETKPLIK